MTLTHWMDNDEAMMKHNKVGVIVKAGEIICFEGTDGASANHIHLVVGRGSSDIWVKNSKGSIVIKGDCKKPEEVMYINKNFTKVANNGGIAFKEMPKEPPKVETTQTSTSFFGNLGYFKFGDNHENIGKICQFMHDEFYKYGEWLGLDNEKILGNYYGPIIEAYIKEFQRRAKEDGKYNSTVDGCVGPVTLESLKKYGFKY